MRAVTFCNDHSPDMASYRYRTQIPAQQIGCLINDESADVVVLGKPTHVGFAESMKRKGKILVADFCDDHFSHPSLGPIYSKIAELADYCVCPTEEMRKRIPSQSIAVIPDPYEMEEVEPHADGDKVIWFGHNAGLSALYYQPPNLTIVTGPKIGKGMVQYSPETLREEMSKANIAIFPTIKGHEYKSPNRLLNALRMGLFPVCDRHPSYVEFKSFIWASDVPTGIKWCGEFRSELNGLVKAGQDYIRDRYSPKAIGLQWKDFLEAL